MPLEIGQTDDVILGKGVEDLIENMSKEELEDFILQGVAKNDDTT